MTMPRRLAALLVLLVACSEPSTPEPGREGPATPPRNIVLVTLDTTRADRIGAYGYAGAETPTLDALAASGTLFERAWAPTPITLPSHATLLTGLAPAAHGARNNGTYELAGEVETLAEMLQARGFATGAFVSAFVLDRRFGLAQGFDHYGDDLTGGSAPVNALEIRSRPAERTVDEAIGWLDGIGGEPFFLWLHLFDPHQPYRLEGDLAVRFADRPYDGEIAHADREVGRLLAHLERLGVRGETAVIVTADHGESLGEHGEDTHGLFLYDSTLRVPLILQHSGSVPAGRRVEDAAGLVDVTPTILALLGLPVPDGVQGRSLLTPPAAPPELLIETVLPAESYGWSPLAGVVADGRKYIRAPIPELYDLAADPDESENLWDPADETSRRLARLHARTVARLEPPAAAERSIDSEEERALRSLGYVFAGSRGGGEAPDPKVMVALVDALKHAASLVATGRHAAAREPLEQVLAADPQSYDALWMLAEVEIKEGRTARAEELFSRARRIRPEKGQALIGLGKIARARGDSAAARRLFEEATADPASVDAHLNLALTWIDTGNLPRAAEVLEAAAETFPYSEKLHYTLALVYLEQGRRGDAREAVDRALALQPGYAPARELAARLGAAAPG